MSENLSISRPAAPRPGYARSRETRARILAAALTEAGEVGFHKTSIARIASRAGVALGNVNYHFGSKAQLLRELMVSLTRDLQSRMHDSVPVGTDDFFEKQRGGLIAYLEYLRDNPTYARLSDEVKLHEPEMYRLAVERWIDLFTLRVRQGIEHGSMRRMDESEIRTLGHFLFGGLQHIHRLIQSEHDPGDEALVEHLIHMLRSGLAQKH